MSLALWVGVYLGVAVLLGLAYHFRPNDRQALAFVGALLAAVAAIAQLQAQAIQYGASVRHQKIEAAFGYMRDWEGKPFTDVLSKSNSALGAAGKMTPQEVDAYLGEHSDEKNAVLMVFNNFEDAALAVRVGYVDGPTLCRSVSQPALEYFSTFRDWVNYFRKTQQKLGAWENYEWLYNQWKDGCPSIPAGR